MRAFLFLSWTGLGLSLSLYGVQRVTENGYPDCVELSNDEVRVVLEPNRGGRVLKYEWEGENILYLDPRDDGQPPGQRDHRSFGPSGGRFDVGPEKITPRGQASWLGTYGVEVLGPRAARLTGPEDPELGVQLIRDFSLADSGSKLVCTQSIRNVSAKPLRLSHWSRTFAVGNGVVLWPANPGSRFPRGYLIYGPGAVMDFEPEDPAVRQRGDVFEIFRPPSRPKFVMDPGAGWLAYAAPNDLLFIKTFPIYPEKAYGEMSAASASIWYYRDEIVEIEPIGPWEWIPPGEEVSFSETWHLFPFPFPRDRKPDLGRITALLDSIRVAP